MPKSRNKSRAVNKPNKFDSSQQRRFEAESIALQSMRLIAAPKPEDDLSDAELDDICRSSKYSSDLIKNLIECIKSI